MQNRTVDIPRQRFSSVTQFHEEHERPGLPVIIEDGTDLWGARQTFTLEGLKSMFGELEMAVSIDLPTSGSPFAADWQGHACRMRFKHFIDHIQTCDKPAYLHRVFTHKFPAADRYFDFSNLTPSQSGKCWTFLWVGSAGTRSGFHFDIENNLLAQISGRKKITMVHPKHTRYLAPYADNIFKSRLDPEQPEVDLYPAFGNAELYVGTLHPGDVLYIPQPWWHNLTSLDPSVSISYVYGEEASLPYLVKAICRSGPAAVTQAIRDFVRLGLMGGAFNRRLFSDPPTGKYLYDVIRDGLARRLLSPTSRSA